MPPVVEPVDELDALQAGSAGRVEAAVREYVRCVAQALLGGRPDPSCVDPLRDALSAAGALADVFGRLRALREATVKHAEPSRTIRYATPAQVKRVGEILSGMRVGEARRVGLWTIRRRDRERWVVGGPGMFAPAPFRLEVAAELAADAYEAAGTPLPALSEPPLKVADAPEILGMGFEKAVDDLTRRVPELAQDSDAIRATYERGGFALVRSADQAITRQVQEAIAAMIAEGQETPSVRDVIESLDSSFTGPYVETVVRNAVNRAYAAGRMRQARELDDVVGLEFNAVMDSSTRPNHAAADGVVAAVDDPIWNRLSPPL